MSLILTIDTGTTSMRGIIYDSDGKSIFISRHPLELSFPGEGLVEQNPGDWSNNLFSILEDCARKLRKTEKSLSAISVTALRSPVIAIDADNKPIGPAIMWQDRRTDEICSRFTSNEEAIYNICGLPVGSVFSAVKMLWIKENRPEIYKEAKLLTGVYEYLIFLLTGNWLTDYSIASRTNLFNLHTCEWDNELIKLFNLSVDKLPSIVPPGSVGGTFSGKKAGFPELGEEIPVVLAGGDQQCAALGLGASDSGEAAFNTGTGAYLIGLTSKPVFDYNNRIYCNYSAVPGNYITEKSIMTAGTIYRWFNRTFFTGNRDAESFEQLNAEIEASEPGSKGVRLLPFFKGTPENANIKGSFINLDLNTSRSDMGRAVLEGIACEMSSCLDIMQKNTGVFKKVSISGGLTNFGIYNQILADMTGNSLEVHSDGEATAFGAWMNAAVAIGLFKNHAEAFRSRSCAIETIQPDKKTAAMYNEIKKEISKLRKALTAPAEL